MATLYFSSEGFQADNRAFLFGDAVKAPFFIRNGALIMAEECYFFLMASMRKMRMRIPLTYTLEFFQELLNENVISNGVSNAIVMLQVYRQTENVALEKAAVGFFGEVTEVEDLLNVRGKIKMDMTKEITVNNNLLSNIRVHCPENIYGEIYAKENELDDLILLNPNKRIARSIYGNLLFLKEGVISVPKQTEGAYISPLMENFVTFVHKNKLAEIVQAEMIAFESQKADEILVISDEKGIFAVGQIRNKSFERGKFKDMVSQWRASFL